MTATIERRAGAARHSSPAPTGGAAGSRVGWALIGLSIACWLIALPGLGHARSSQYGLLATASPLFTTSFVVGVLAFIACVRTGQFRAGAAALLVVTVEQRLPFSGSTAVPVYSWTYKHLGVVDYIQHHGALAHGVDVYNGWPGLFAFTAWFSELSGVPAQSIAHWFTPILHLLLLGLVYAVGRAWDLDPMVALVASFLFEVLDWVGQDYYSPQAAALVFVTGFLIVLGRSRKHAVAAPVALIIFAAAVVDHQLTPYWLIAATLVLTLLRRVHPRWLVFAMIGVAGAFLAFNYDSVANFPLLSLHPVSNAESNVPTIGVLGQRVTSAIVRGLSVVIWVSSVLAAAYQLRRRARIVEPAVIAFSSFLLLGGQSYGGEAIFRVFLYSLFGCSLVLAPVLTRLLTARLRWTVPVAVVMAACMVASAQGLYGSWFANRMSSSEVVEAKKLLADVPVGNYVTVAAPVWPERPTGRYVDFIYGTAPGAQAFDYPMIYEAKLIGNNFDTAASYEKLMTIAAGRQATTYLIITEQMKLYDWYFGILPLHALDNLAARLRKDPRWTVYKASGDYTIFKSTTALSGGK